MLLHHDVDRTHPRSVAIGLFKRMDTNNSGSLSYTEIQCRLNDLGIEERKRDLIIAMIDSDHDHKVTLREFAVGFGRFQAAVSCAPRPCTTISVGCPWTVTLLCSSTITFRVSCITI